MPRTKNTTTPAPPTPTTSTLATRITELVQACFTGLYIETHEPLRAIATIGTETWQAFSWDCQRGIIERETGKTVEDITDPLAAIKWLGSRNDTVLFVQNFHHFMAAVEVIQEIQNSIPVWKGSGCCLVMVGPRVQLPVEIDSFMTILDFRLPSLEELRRIQQELGQSVGAQAPTGPTTIRLHQRREA